jgi:hypothetical protein
MSEEINGVIGSSDDKGEVVVIVVSGKIPKKDAAELKEELKKLAQKYKLTVKAKKSA